MKLKTGILFFFLFNVFSCFAQEEYLSDRGWYLEYNSVSEAGRKKAQIDRNFNHGPLVLWGIPYENGLGMHANGKIVFSLHGEYEWFLATIGIDDAAGEQGSAVFKVLGDGNQLYESPLMTGGSGIEDIRLNIKKIDMLELRVDGGGDVENDLANWVNARILPAELSVNWQWLGEYQGFHQAVNRIYVEYPEQDVLLELCTPNIVRIRHSDKEKTHLKYPAKSVVRDQWEAVDYKLEDLPEHLIVTTDSLRLKISKNPFDIQFTDKEAGKLLASHLPGKSYGYSENMSTVRFQMDASGEQEAFYGGGLRFERFNLRGATIRNWATYVNRPRSTGEIEVTIPLILSTNGYGLFLDNSFESRFMFGSETPDIVEYKTYGGVMDYYFIGGSLKQIVEDYYRLTGHSNMPLKKSLGLNFRGRSTRKNAESGNRWDAQQFVAVADEFRKRSIPMDVIATEPGWSTDHGNLSWADEVFPKPEEWVQDLTSCGLLVNHWIYGHVSPADSALYENMKPFAGEEGYPDVFSEKGMDIYFEFLKNHHFDAGISGFKEDSHANRIRKGMKFPGGTVGEELHNSYWFYWLREIYQRYRAEYGKRYYSQMATGYAGMQRFAPAIYADYLQNLDKVSQAMSSTGWFGLFYSPEIQGYYIPDDAHYMRMTQIAAFSPIMIHNEWMGGELPWTKPKPVYQNYLKYVRLHYRLIPYLYSYIWQQHRNGESAIRSLPLEFQEDKETHNIGTQYMYGRSLMVVPVWDKKSNFTKRDIYFPKGQKWYDYETGEVFEGGTWLNDKSFPLNKLPLYVRGGAIIPTMEVPDYIGQKPLTEITLDIYPEGTSRFILYEDDGETFMYERENYSLTNIHCERQEMQTTISISAREGDYSGMPENRIYQVRIHGVIPGNVNVDGNNKDYQLDHNVIFFKVEERDEGNLIIVEHK